MNSSTNRNSMDEDNDLNIRVQEKPVEQETKKSRIGNLIKEGKGLKDGAVEALKRPVTGLFRRPGGRKKMLEVDESSGSPQAPPSYRMNFSKTLEDVTLNDDDSPKRKNADVADERKDTRDYLRNIANGLLDSDSLNSVYPNLSKLDDIDLSILSINFPAEDETVEEDEPWNWDYLFTNITTELREEWTVDNEEEFGVSQ